MIHSRSTSFAVVASVLILLPALGVMAGWWQKIPLLVQIFPGYVGMVFNTALCFALAAGALLLPESRPELRRMGQIAVGSFIIFLSSAVLLQYVFTFNLGIDFPALHSWLSDPNPHRGRMAPNTCLGFILSGAILILMNYGNLRWAAFATQLLTFLVLMIGVSGLIGYALKLELLYSWYRFTRMALHTAALFMLLGVAFWLNWGYQRWIESLYQGREDEKITGMGAAILVLIALVTGLGVFVSMQQQNEKALKEALTNSLNTRSSFFNDAVAQAVQAGQSFGMRILVIDRLSKLNADPNDRVSAEILSAVAHTGLAVGFDGLTFYDRSGRQVMRVGRFVHSPQAIFPLSLSESVQLLSIDKRIVLRMQLPIMRGGRQIGSLQAERPMPYLMRMFGDFRAMGKSGEMLVCAQGQPDLACFPTRLEPARTFYPPANDGIPTPVVRALNGGEGVTNTLDYRGEKVIAAYGPIGDLGLGMVIKMDAEELYAPIRTQFQFVLPLIGLLILVGTLMLRWLVKPLVRRVLDSEGEAHAANRALAHSELRVRAVVENATDAIITLDEQGQVQSFNRAAVDMFGYTPQEIIGQNVMFLMPPALRPRHEAGMQNYLQGGTARVVGKGPVEMQAQRKNGELFPIELGINEIKLDTQRVFIGMLRDITERSQAQQVLAHHTQELARSNAELENFARVASHDLQEPLRKVQAFGDRLQAKYSAQIGPEGLDFLARMLGAAARMQSLIEGLLMFSRVSTRAQPFARVDLNEVVREVLADLEVRIAETDTCVQVDTLPIVQAEPLQMRQLFQNLLGNALKFHRSGVSPELRVSASEQAIKPPAMPRVDFYEITIEDNGIGFEEKYVDRIFGIFQRLHGRNEYEGSGVGLAICRKIVEYHGGAITARSQPGVGTRFIFTLPLLQPERPVHVPIQ